MQHVFYDTKFLVYQILKHDTHNVNSLFLSVCLSVCLSLSLSLSLCLLKPWMAMYMTYFSFLPSSLLSFLPLLGFCFDVILWTKLVGLYRISEKGHQILSEANAWQILCTFTFLSINYLHFNNFCSLPCLSYIPTDKVHGHLSHIYSLSLSLPYSSSSFTYSMDKLLFR